MNPKASYIGALHRGQITDIVEYDSDFIFIGSADSTISVFNKQTKKVIPWKIYNSNLTGINCLSVYDDILFVGCDEKLLIFKIQQISQKQLDYTLLKQQPLLNSMITSISMSKFYIFITTDTSMIYVLSNVDLLEITEDFGHQNSIILSKVINYKGKQILITFDINKKLHFYDTKKLRLLFTCVLPYIATGLYYNEQKNLLYISYIQKIIVYEVQNDKISQIQEINTRLEDTSLIQIEEHKNHLYYYDQNNIFQLDVKTYKEQLFCKLPEKQIISFLYIQDDDMYVGTNHGIVVILKL